MSLSTIEGASNDKSADQHAPVACRDRVAGIGVRFACSQDRAAADRARRHPGGRGVSRPSESRPSWPWGASGLVKDDVNEATQSSTRDRLLKEYATDEIAVEWEPRLCFHSQNCIRSLPKVFDESRRPWVKVDAATADEVEAAVALCPSGALRTRRIGVSVARRQQTAQVRASPNGPLLVSGGVRTSTRRAKCSTKARKRRSVDAAVLPTSPSAMAHTRRTASVADRRLTLYQSEWRPFSSAVREARESDATR